MSTTATRRAVRDLLAHGLRGDLALAGFAPNASVTIANPEIGTTKITTDATGSFTQPFTPPDGRALPRPGSRELVFTARRTPTRRTPPPPPREVSAGGGLGDLGLSRAMNSHSPSSSAICPGARQGPFHALREAEGAVAHRHDALLDGHGPQQSGGLGLLGAARDLRPGAV